MLILDKVYLAGSELRDFVRKTDMIYSPHLSRYNDVFLKTENLQRTGSFKVRGAYFKIANLTKEEKAKGVVACSAGNHAQGVALAAQKFGIKARIFLPSTAPISKVEATRAMGAEIHMIDGVYDDAYDAAIEYCEEKDLTFIHPFDDEYVMAGQATVALEILEQLPEVEAIVVPIGGGGLIGGVASAIKAMRPHCKVFGVQAENAVGMYSSFKEGKINTVDTVSTFADGIAVKCPGKLTFEACMQHVDDIFTVTEDQIATAILTLMEKEKLVAEGAGAVGVAALMFNKIPIRDLNVAAIISGGNIDVNILSRVIERGLLTSGRRTNLVIELLDKPGQLELVSSLIAKAGGNVTGVHYTPGGRNMAIDGCYLDLSVETKNHKHIKDIKTMLRDNGFTIVGDPL